MARMLLTHNEKSLGWQVDQPQFVDPRWSEQPGIV